MLAATAETTPPNRLNATSRLLFLLIAIVGGIAFYFLVLIEHGTEHVSRRNFRTLAQMETQITGGFERILSVAELHNFGTPLNVAGHQYKVLYDTPDHCISEIDRAFGIASRIGQRMCYRTKSRGNNMLLDLDIQITDAKTLKETNLVVKDVHLSHLLDFGNGQEQFQQVLIFDATRQLALRSSSDTDFDSDLDAYDQISNLSTTHESVVELPKSWNRSESANNSDKKTAGDNAEEQSLLITKVQEFTVGNQKYLAFVRPFTLPFPEAGQAGRPEVWYAVGITTKATFNASRFMLPRWWTAMMVLGLSMMALSLPYIKLKLLGPQDLITTWTITWATLGLIVGMVIGTTMLFNFCSHHASERKMVEAIGKMGGRISELLNEEYADRTIDLKRTLVDFPNISEKDLPAFERVSVFRSNGDIYATTPPDVTFNAFSIDDRQYWRRLLYNRSLHEDSSNLTFAQETVESKFDGTKKTVLAMRSNTPISNACSPGWNFFKPCPVAASPDSFHVAAAFFRYKILDKIVLPKGFGFIVVDNVSGVVQYHSEEHANMVERLYEETDNNPELKAAINAHEQRTFGTDYRGQLFFFSTHPLAYSDWTLITYFNRELLDRVNLGLLLTATGISLAYLSILVLGMVLAYRLLSHTRINHLWPNQHQGVAYARLSVLLAIVALAEAIAIYALHAEELLIVLLSSPVLALSGAYLCLVGRYRHLGWLAWPRVSRAWRGQWRRPLLQMAALGSTMALLYSFVATLEYTSLADVSLWIVVPLVSILSGLITTLARWLTARLIATLKIRQASCQATDRRANRDPALFLHRCCVTLLVVIGALLPTVAFFRDTTALHVLQWLQEDARKMRHQLERMASNPLLEDTSHSYQRRLQALIDYNERSATLAHSNGSPCGEELEEKYIYAPSVAPSEPQSKQNPYDIEAMDAIMWPVIEVNKANSLPLRWLKLTAKNEDAASLYGTPTPKEWLRCRQLHKKEMVSLLPLQHREVVHTTHSSALNILQRWHYSEIGLLQWYSLWLGVAGVMLLIVHPMVRRVLRELASESDLRPHPNLTRTELELLCADWHGVVLLISPASLRRNTEQRSGWTLAMFEADIAEKLASEFPDLRVRRLDSAMQNPEPELPHVLVAAEYKWPAHLTESAERQLESPEFPNGIPWKKFLVALNKLRLPDDFPGLALNHWLPPRHFTLLVCHSIEAQRTLTEFIAQRPASEGNKWQMLQPGPMDVAAERIWSGHAVRSNIWQIPQPGEPIRKRIWISHIEKILHLPTQRRHLLDFLENARLQPELPAIIMTGLILPHQWMADPSLWNEQPPDALERARWLRLLANVDVRSVESLNYEHDLEERTRAYHALPRASREAEYELWWEYSTPAEQLAMAALAHEGLINPLNQVVIRSLIARGIIFRLRKLRFCDHSFREFVRHRLPATELHRRADLALQSSSWGAARGPLLITLAALGYAVMAMGGGTVETVVALVTSIGASIPALLNLTRLLRRDGSA